MAMVRSALAALLALVLVGGHIAALQAIAWAGMLAARVQQQGWSGAVSSTFDGAHPCDMCRVVQRLRTLGDGPSQGPSAPDPLPKAVKKPDLWMPSPVDPIVDLPAGPALGYSEPLAPTVRATDAPDPPPPRA